MPEVMFLCLSIVLLSALVPHQAYSNHNMACFSSVIIVGTSGDDVIYGTDGPDVIRGMGGNDIIYGQEGNDIICGEGGNDTIYGWHGDDILFGELVRII